MSRPGDRHLDNLPPALARAKSDFGLRGIWRDITKKIYSPRIIKGLPPFAERMAWMFWETDPDEAIRAIRQGDPAFFVSFLLRLDQIDCACVEAERTVAERAPIIRAKWIIDGFRQAAEQRLIAKGGKWPPVVVTPEAET